MRIMLINDDGINAPGIWALYDEFAGENDVTVCAPHQQCSGFSHSITIGKELRARRFARGDARAFEVFGTPADCALLGLGALTSDRPDLVISGINDGFNAAGDVHYSGTIGAACEACMQGVPALAVSTRGGNKLLAHTLAYTRRVLKIMLANPLPGCFYSLNVPAGEPKGLRYSRLGGRDCGKECEVKYFLRSGESGDGLYSVEAQAYKRMPNSDVDSLMNGYATYTAISSDWTAQGNF